MSAEDYRTYVEHPRYGREPRLTHLRPPRGRKWKHLHWHSPPEDCIPETAVEADTNLQRNPSVLVTHYFDVRRVCRDCGRKFIFFADQQKHWYEVLDLKLDVNCVRCFPCRKIRHRAKVARERYDELIHHAEPGPVEWAELAELTVDLIQLGAFSNDPRTVGRAQMWLNRARKAGAPPEQVSPLAARIAALLAP